MLCLFPGVLWLWISYIVSVHIIDQASIYTLSLCRGHSWRVRLAKQETLTPPGHLVSSLVCRGSVKVHRGALLLVPQWQCISSLISYILRICFKGITHPANRVNKATKTKRISFQIAFDVESMTHSSSHGRWVFCLALLQHCTDLSRRVVFWLTRRSGLYTCNGHCPNLLRGYRVLILAPSNC